MRHMVSFRHFHFNPRLREGGDQETGDFRLFDWIFQSTPPRRRRHRGMVRWCRLQNFNPRLQEGGDAEDIVDEEEEYNFNPRLQEGGDHHVGIVEYVENDFNPRLQEGGDKNSIFLCAMMYDFNPRLQEGGDAFAIAASFLIWISIHASKKEATQGGFWSRIINIFQSTPPRRRRRFTYSSS